jgi:uncharacterized protein
MPEAGIHGIVLKVAGLCNLNCSYCYLYQHGDRSYLRRPKFMSAEVFEQFLFRVREYCDRRAPHSMGITFHGGEPTLIGCDWINRAAARAREYLNGRLAGLSIQTNGTLLNQEWAEVFRDCGVHVSISMDGTPVVHDGLRVDHAGKGSYEATVAGLRLLQDSGADPNILCVIDPSVSGLEVYKHLRSLGVRRMNFLMPDVTHDEKQQRYGRFGATPIADYLIPVFDDWFEEDNPNIRIRMFWDMIAMIRGGRARTDAFGNPRMSYVIVETDGTIHANDVLRICGDDFANAGLNVFEHGFDALQYGSPLLHQLVEEGMTLCATCQTCPERAVCGGGHVPHRYAKRNGFDNPSVWCADFLKLLAHIRGRM